MSPEFRVQLGAFDQPAEGWYNTDITPHLFIARVPGAARVLRLAGRISAQRYLQHRQGVFKRLHYLDLRKTFPFRDDSVDAYFASHVLEHLHLHETRHVLNEIRRTLKSGGFARFSLPDLDHAVRLYDSAKPEAFLEFIFAGPARGGAGAQHKWMYTRAYAARLLRDAGFTRIWQQECDRTHYPPFHGLDNRPGQSFYIETQKA